MEVIASRDDRVDYRLLVLEEITGDAGPMREVGGET